MRPPGLGPPRGSLLVLAALGGGCAPWGRIYTPQGEDRLLAAWHTVSTESGVPVLLMVLANSPLECGLPDTEDNDEITDATLEYYHARTREGARLVGLKLYALETGDWEGRYDVRSDLEATDLTDADPRAAFAIYIGVEEAITLELHGLYRLYEPTEETRIYGAEGPGEVVLSSFDDEAEGLFSLESIDVSGSFRTESCGEVDTVFQWLGLLLESESGTGSGSDR